MAPGERSAFTVRDDALIFPDFIPYRAHYITHSKSKCHHNVTLPVFPVDCIKQRGIK